MAYRSERPHEVAVAYELMRVVNAALDGACINSLSAGIEWRDVYRMALSHSLDAASWFAVRDTSDMDGRIRAAWEHRMQLASFRSVRMAVERDAVFAQLESERIAFLPLRGARIAACYPHPEMRTMSDVDFLYGYVEEAPEGGFCLTGSTEMEQALSLERAMLAVRDIAVGRGYRIENLRGGHHDSYCKEPCYNLEPHRTLFVSSSPFSSYYANPWRLAHREQPGSHRFAMDASDEYIYFIAHAHKHVMGPGMGLRLLADTRVLLRERGRSMDEAYIARELDDLGIRQFERTLRSLAGRLATGERLSAEEEGLFAYLAHSGSYGTIENYVSRQIELVAGGATDGESQDPASSASVSRVRARYLANRLSVFLADHASAEQQFPRLARYRVTAPILAVARVSRQLVRSRKKLLKELKVLLSYR